MSRVLREEEQEASGDEPKGGCRQRMSSHPGLGAGNDLAHVRDS